jgi:hypothetical protein
MVFHWFRANYEQPPPEVGTARHSLTQSRGLPVNPRAPPRPHANKLFMLFRTWLRKQFAQMGHKADADQLAMHLLSRSQGIATLANAFDDAAFIKQEVDQLLEWLNAYLKPHQPQGVPSDVHRPA